MATMDFYAQFGEDKILNDIFYKNNGTCIEVGGYDGVTGSNTYFFEKLGWKCIVVEPMPDFCQKIRDIRNCEVVEAAASDKTGEANFYVAKGIEVLSTMEAQVSHLNRIKKEGGDLHKITVRTERLSDILRDKGVDEIDFITIDVEGHEISVLRGLSFDTVSPRIFIIEDNSNGLNHDVNKFMESLSYVRFKKTGCNHWYARKNDVLVTWKSVAATDFLVFRSAVKQKIKQLLGL